MPTPPSPSRRRFLVRSAQLGLGLSAAGLAGFGPGPAPRARAAPSGRRVLAEDLHAPTLDAASVGTPAGASPALRAGAPFTQVGLHWRGPSDVPAWLQTGPDGLAWTPWRRLGVERTAGETPRADETFAALVSAPRHRFVRYRFEADGPNAVVATCLNSLDGERLGPTLGVGGALLAGLRQGVALAGAADFRTGIITREQWEADESLRFDPDGSSRWPQAYVAPRALVIHHTATSNDEPDPAAVVRSIYYYHAVTQGWGDIGYNALLDKDGHIYEGRYGRDVDPYGVFPRDILSYGVVAGHARNYNYGSVGAALIGEYTQAVPSDAMLARLADLLVYELGRHQIDPRTALDFARSTDLWRYGLPALPGHRDCNVTECPGDQVYSRLPDLRERVAARMDAGPPGTPLTEIPTERNPWLGPASYAWDAAAPFEYVFDGVQKIEGSDLAENIVGYDALTMPVHVRTAQRGATFELRRPGQYTLHLRPADSPYAQRATVIAAKHVVRDDADPDVDRRGGWAPSAELRDAYNGAGYLVAQANSGAELAWTLAVPETGTYAVQVCWTPDPGRSKAAAYTFGPVGGPTRTATADQTLGGGTWTSIGSVDLTAGQACRVEVRAASDGTVVADAARLVLND